MNNKRKNVREAALEILEMIEKNQSYSNLLLNNSIKKNEIDKKDIGLLTELTYGTLQRKIALDYYLSPFLAKNKKLESWVRQLLRLTIYQMVYLDKIPDRAAIHEAVEIAKRRGHKGIASLVNGILRSMQREGIPSFDAIEDPIERLSIRTSHPLWLVKRWVSQFGFEETKAMCELNLTAPTMTGRVNTTKISRDECLVQLASEGFEVKASLVVPEAILCLKGNLAHSDTFKKGLLTIQDESSMIVGLALGVTDQQKVLDACAAPGGKSTHIAEKMNGTGEVISLDLHEHKVKLIRENARRLELSNIQAKTLDSRDVQEHFEKESFDRILLDAPCTGLGVMRRKPDIKYTKKEEDLFQLQKIQKTLLESVASLLKKDGILVYSTCTIDQEENQEVVEAFLQQHPEYVRDETFRERIPGEIQSLVKNSEMQILPQYFNSDGFYIACLRKKD
ncbi:16S rRNA (cytosine(967)-C(5))-methyltransferase RsmB [Bacillus sp. V3B]|uniref:16S rRNA (cytosine(967)-C(5))-methyltransferase RsmB n=1 Tax=Bacillus sp. V3B TaxID=2804915 RepID=UPI00210CFD9F|nr:16S rRNA (cytosine(967)-C(5))-methyltransferase RsmB [Bacillus sp. V3B]MCQ6274045.1 16S rRNA (cytosine(967)-C(5))-methyltransferase RsmB [Bacillus sp. V3B]